MNLWPFGRSRQEEELEREIQAHLAMAARDRMDRGEPPHAAEQAARREFGNRELIKETTRDIWGWTGLERFVQDVRYALRGMRRRPGFTAMAVASLALGIGANTAIFSLMNAVMLRLLPVRQPEALVELLQKYPGEPRGTASWTPESYRHIRDRNTVFSALIGTSIDHRVDFRASHREREMVVGEYVTGNYFSGLGVTPAIGRFISPRDNPMSAAGAVGILSWSYWTGRFNQNPTVVGERVFLQGEPVTIIGVAPRSFVGLRIDTVTDVWLPRKPSDQISALVGQLKPGVSLTQVRAELPLLYRSTMEARSASSKDPLIRQMTIEAESAGSGLIVVRDRLATPLTVLMVIVGLLLILTCVNIAGLLLARGAYRQREIALRVGLGASLRRLLTQMMTESLLLAALATLAGIVLAYFATKALLAVFASGRLHEQIHLRVAPDLHMLVFAAGIALLAALLFGLAPALHLLFAAPFQSLGQTRSTNATRFQPWFGKGLVALQVALSLLLLSTGALFIQHLWSLEHQYLGFRRDHVLLVTLDPSGAGDNAKRLAGGFHEVLNRLQRMPGVVSASLCAPTPLSGAGASGFATVEGYQERPSDRRYVGISWIAPHYFATMGSPLFGGRDFEPQDEQRPRVAIINQTMARRYFANRNPIGRYVTLDQVTLDPEPKRYQIVGLVGDSNYYQIREPSHSSIYLPAFHDEGVSAHNLVLRTTGEPDDSIGDVRKVVRDVLRAVPVDRATSLSAQVDASIVPERLLATLSGFFAVLGALLAGIGIYGLLAFTVARRTNEIGIRMALGATASRVVGMIVFDAVAIVLAGLILGIPIALYCRRLAATVIPNVPVPTAFPFATAVTLIVAGAMLAAYLPARRAATVDPMESLRHD